MPMHRKLAALITAALTLTALPLAAQEPPGPEDGAFISTVMMTCERGIIVPVAYVSTAGGTGFAVMHLDGRQVAMHQVVSGSGVRYRSIDDAHPYELHSKGRDGIIAYGPDGDTELLLAECVAE